jgi:hypothetical protein
MQARATTGAPRPIGSWGSRLAFALVFAIGAVLWSVAAARGLDLSPWTALPYGVSQMTVAGVLSIAIWRFTALVPWSSGPARFFGANAVAMTLFAVSYTAAQAVPLLPEHPALECLRAPFAAPVAGWNLLMGAWLYLAIGGVCYSRRSEFARRDAQLAQAEMKVLARDAQLGALNAQLQPHFLFNALHTVGALVHADPDAADRAIEELGKLLRYALGPHGADVPLADEWRFTRDYLAFERLRLGDRLRLAIDVDDEALDAEVPPFVLQPLVENAVRCGASESPAGGDVAIRIGSDGRRVILTVRNSVETSRPNGMAGSGLRRLGDRLALRYGADRASVTIENGRHFEVTVTLPAEMPGASV